MATLSLASIGQTAYQAGFRDKDLVVAIAVAFAESRGKTDAYGDGALQTSVWGPSVGLFQIRSLKAEKGKGTVRDELANLDPQTNANHAFQIWKQSGWGAWSSHSNGSYLLWMAPATSAAAIAQTTGNVTGVYNAAGDAVSEAVSPILEVAKEPIRMLKWLGDPGSQIRIAKVIVGGALVIAAFQIIVRPYAMSAVGTVASVVAPVKSLAGKVAK